MPIDPTMSHEEIVRELMNAYKEKGKIKNTKIESEEEALKIANAIAYKMKED